MSRYLLRRIEETPTIHIRTRTEIVALEGNGHLERVQWRDGTGAFTSHDVRHVFLMTGAEANTRWLNGRVALDAKGFIKTGPDLTCALQGMAQRRAVAAEIGTAGRLLAEHFDRFSADFDEFLPELRVRCAEFLAERDAG
jgi:hypothetical protein